MYRVREEREEKRSPSFPFFFLFFHISTDFSVPRSSPEGSSEDREMEQRKKVSRNIRPKEESSFQLLHLTCALLMRFSSSWIWNFAPVIAAFLSEARAKSA